MHLKDYQLLMEYFRRNRVQTNGDVDCGVVSLTFRQQAGTIVVASPINGHNVVKEIFSDQNNSLGQSQHLKGKNENVYNEDKVMKSNIESTANVKYYDDYNTKQFRIASIDDNNNRFRPAPNQPMLVADKTKLNKDDASKGISKKLNQGFAIGDGDEITHPRQSTNPAEADEATEAEAAAISHLNEPAASSKIKGQLEQSSASRRKDSQKIRSNSDNAAIDSNERGPIYPDHLYDVYPEKTTEDNVPDSKPLATVETPDAVERSTISTVNDDATSSGKMSTDRDHNRNKDDCSRYDSKDGVAIHVEHGKVEKAKYLTADSGVAMLGVNGFLGHLGIFTFNSSPVTDIRLLIHFALLVSLPIRMSPGAVPILRNSFSTPLVAEEFSNSHKYVKAERGLCRCFADPEEEAKDKYEEPNKNATPDEQNPVQTINVKTSEVQSLDEHHDTQTMETQNLEDQSDNQTVVAHSLEQDINSQISQAQGPDHVECNPISPASQSVMIQQGYTITSDECQTLFSEKVNSQDRTHIGPSNYRPIHHHSDDEQQPIEFIGKFVDEDDRYVSHETPRTLEHAEENMEVQNTPHDGKGPQETVILIEDLEDLIPENSSRDGEPIQKTLRELEDTLREADGAQEATQTLGEVNRNKNFDMGNSLDIVDENVRLELKDHPREANRAQETARTHEDVDDNVRLQLEDASQEYHKNINLDLDNSLEVSYENVLLELKDDPQEDVDDNEGWKLKDVPEEYKPIHAFDVCNAFEEVGETNLLGLAYNVSEKQEEETSVKSVAYYATSNHYDLILEEPNASLLDDNETGTTSKYPLKSVSVEIKETTFSTDTARQLLFEWLSGQEGVTCYYYACNEITIHVTRGARVASTIDIIIKTQFPQLRHAYKILDCDPGLTIPCVRPCVMPPCLSERGKPVLTPSEEEIIYPGTEISCRSLGSEVAKYGTFSGKICGYGLMAGHIVSSGSDMVRTSSIFCKSQVIGTPILPIEYVRVPIPGTQKTRKTLADLLFSQMNDQGCVNNYFYGDPLNSGRPELFDIVLHRGSIRESDRVMVILRHEKVVFGKIASVDFSLGTVSNTLEIVDENNRAITADGDSGAIVVLLPNRGDRILRAIGVVTHLHCIPKPEFEGTNYTELNADNSISVGTIAIRLYEVLVAIQEGVRSGVPNEFTKVSQLSDCIEFSGPPVTPQFDSGI